MISDLSNLKINNFNQMEREYFAELILFLNERTSKDFYHQLFGRVSDVGTFTLGDLKKNPKFLYHDLEDGYFEHWMEDVISRDIRRLIKYSHILLTETTINQIIEATNIILEFRLFTGDLLCEQIPYQIFADIFRRIISFFLSGNPAKIYHTYQSTNTFVHKICFEVLNNSLISHQDIKKRLKRAVLAGLLGLNLKDDLAATSPIIETNLIALDQNSSLQNNASHAINEFDTRLQNDFAIDFFSSFERDIVDSPKPIKICFFSDDYAESIFDLDFIQALLDINRTISIELIPRRYNFSNDLSFIDVQHILSDPYFDKLCIARRENRFLVNPFGPLLSAIDPRGISDNIAEKMRSSDYLIVKGARAYEMLQGVNIDTYYGFSVSREFSETVTGLNAELCEPVLIKQNRGAVTFSDFKAREWRKQKFKSGRIVGLARETALENSIKRTALPR